MSAQAGNTVKIGRGMIVSTVTDGLYLTRQARARGFARLVFPGSDDLESSLAYDNYGRVNLAQVRAALDAISLEDAPFADVRITKPMRDWSYWGTHRQQPMQTYGPDRKPSCLRFRLGNDGSRVRILAPCGETRVYSLASLDRALTALGF